MNYQSPPTLAEVCEWPASVPIAEAGRALGISRATCYRLERNGTFPVRTVRVAPKRIVAITADLIRILSGEGA